MTDTEWETVMKSERNIEEGRNIKEEKGKKQKEKY